MNTTERNQFQDEMLSPREQLMEDIDAIVDEHSYCSNMSAEKTEDLIRVLCDAVCKNFPSSYGIEVDIPEEVEL